MQREIYLDNSATTRISDGALEKYVTVSKECWGNPSSLHGMGFSAEKELSAARESLLRSLGAVGSTVVFTASGSEANNTAILGVAYAKQKRRQNRIITTDSEHPSVENVMKKLEADGFEVVRLSTRGGVIDEGQFLANMNAETSTITIIIKSTIISNCLAVENSVTMPIAHIIIRTTGSRYLITKDQVFPTLNVECSLRAGRKCSTP